MKFISFNVNGLRSRIHQLKALINKYDPDVIGLQETKVHDDYFPTAMLASFGYYLVFHGQKGHYGVALMSKIRPTAVQKGFLCDDQTAQRRLVKVELPTALGNITVINGYFPQGENKDHPVKYPMKKKFYQDLCDQIISIDSQNGLVVIMGDMNIAPTDHDIGISVNHQKHWLRTGKTSFLPEERTWIKQIFDLGYCDIFRKINPTAKHFSWFDYRSGGFNSDTGLRIDLILASFKLASLCTGAGIDYTIRGMEKPSDHAPVWAEFKLL